MLFGEPRPLSGTLTGSGVRAFEARPRGQLVAVSAEAEKVRIENSFPSQLTNCMFLFPPFVGEHRRKTLGEELGFLPLDHTGEKATYIERPGTSRFPPHNGCLSAGPRKTHRRSGSGHHSQGTVYLFVSAKLLDLSHSQLPRVIPYSNTYLEC